MKKHPSLGSLHPALRIIAALAVLAGVGWWPAAARAQVGSVTTLHSFTGADGSSPYSSLVLASDGNFYGTTPSGGASNYGTAFQLTPAGTLTTLYTFTGQSDGSLPYGGLIQGTDGNFYGTTFEGGPSGAGTVFQLTPAGVLTTLYAFAGSNDGAYPHAGVIQGSDGNFYGTTLEGGTSGYGTVFKLTPGGVLTTLYSFTGATDGGQLYAGVIQGRDGNFYGTTEEGGANGIGTVFQLTPGGILTTLHSFAGGADGSECFASLIQANDGNFYGTTGLSGAAGYGTIFQVTPGGTLTVLHSFTYYDGYYPTAALVQANDGNLYGTTQYGGTGSYGTAFKVTLGGAFTSLYNFMAGPDGGEPAASLIQGSDGNFYSTAQAGGTGGLGSVFRLTLMPASVLSFTNANYGVNENAGTVVLTVSRTGGSGGAVSVNYSELDGTAFAGQDYQEVSGTLNWADGDTTNRTITIPINDQQITDNSTRTFSVVLADAGSGAILGSVPTATVTIQENDSPLTQPTILITSPPTDVTVVAGSPLLLGATVNDPSGILSRVEFLLNGFLVATASPSPTYLENAVAPAPGTYQLQAVAIDNLGRQSSSTRTVTVVAPSSGQTATAPAILTPLDQRQLAEGSTITITTASPPGGGPVSRVDFYANGVLFAAFDGSGNPIHGSRAPGQGPVARATAPMPAGTVYQAAFTIPPLTQPVTLTTVMTSQTGMAQASAPVTVQPVASAQTAVVTQSGPANGARFNAQQQVTVPVAVTGTSANVAQVQYYVNGLQVAASSSPPFMFNVTLPMAGQYVLTSVATDTTGLSSVSAPLVVQALPVVTVAVKGDGLIMPGGENGKAIFTRAGDDLSADLTVAYKAAGMAINGTDYQELGGSIVIPAGMASVKLKVKAIANPADTSPLKVNIKLLPSPNNSYGLGTAVKAKLTLIE